MTSNYTCHLRASGTNSFAYYGAVCLWKINKKTQNLLKKFCSRMQLQMFFFTIFNLSKSFLSFIVFLFLHFILHFFIISNIFYLFTMKRITFSFFIAFLSFFVIYPVPNFRTFFGIFDALILFDCFKYWKWNVLIYVEIFHWKYFSYFSSHK